MARKNPPVVPADTSQDVWERQMAAIRARSVAERLAEWAAFNAEMSRLEADAVRGDRGDAVAGSRLHAVVGGLPRRG